MSTDDTQEDPMKFMKDHIDNQHKINEQTNDLLQQLLSMKNKENEEPQPSPAKKRNTTFAADIVNDPASQQKGNCSKIQDPGDISLCIGEFEEISDIDEDGDTEGGQTIDGVNQEDLLWANNNAKSL